MKNLKKVFAVIMALAMIFALSVTAFAATTVSTTEDTSVLKVTSSGNTVTYQAVTVDGGIKDGVSYPPTTVYTYCVKTSNSTATIKFTNPQHYYMYIDGMYMSNGYTFTTVLAKNAHHTIELKTSGGTVYRSFDLAVVDSTSVNVSIEINCYNAKNWLNNNSNASNYATVLSAYNTLSTHVGGFNSIGKMSAVVTLNLPAGSTAMDALNALASADSITVSGSSTYVSGLDGLNASMCGSWSGWCYVTPTSSSPYYNMPSVGAASYTLTEGEHIIWVYTCTYSDIGAAITATTP